MSAVETVRAVPWWKEPTKDQWLAWVASWLGWTLDAFDFTMFLLIMVPISKAFDVSLPEVALVFTLTALLWASHSASLPSKFCPRNKLHEDRSR